MWGVLSPGGVRAGRGVVGQKSGAHQQVCMPQDPATKVLGDLGVSHFHHKVRVPGEGRWERPWRAWRDVRAHGVDSMALTSTRKDGVTFLCTME